MFLVQVNVTWSLGSEDHSVHTRSPSHQSHLPDSCPFVLTYRRRWHLAHLRAPRTHRVETCCVSQVNETRKMMVPSSASAGNSITVPHKGISKAVSVLLKSLLMKLQVNTWSRETHFCAEIAYFKVWRGDFWS